MLRKALGTLACAAVGFVSTPVHAHPLPVEVPAQLSISLAGLAPVVVSSVPTVYLGITSISRGHLGFFTVPASPFNVAGLVVPVTDPAAAPIKGMEATVHNGTGAFRGAPLGGVMPLSGLAKVCLIKACSIAAANLSVPLSLVGVGGIAAYPPGSTSAAVNLTVAGAPWTAGVAAVGTVTQMGFAHGPASATSSTAQGSGALRLVSPIFVSTNIASFAVVPAFAVLDLHFVPEPSTLLLLGGGIAGFVIYGRSKRG
jgi:hypothetical protein